MLPHTTETSVTRSLRLPSEIDTKLDEITTAEYLMYKEPYTYPYSAYNRRILLMIVGLFRSPIFEFYRYSDHYVTSKWLGHSGINSDAVARRAKTMRDMFEEDRHSSIVVQGYDLVRKAHREAYMKRVPKDVFTICLHRYESKESWKNRTEPFRKTAEDTKNLNIHYGAYCPPSNNEGFSIIVDSFEKVLQIPHLIGNF